MLKYLRIGVTALGLTACVLLIALWVRSYWWVDVADLRRVEIESAAGAIQFAYWGSYMPETWNLESFRIEGPIPIEKLLSLPTWGWHDSVVSDSAVVTFPHWFPILVLGVIATLPWTSWSRRFSLRTLLIATTLIAVGLGVIVMAS